MLDAFFAFGFPHTIKPTHIVEYVPDTTKNIHIKFLRSKPYVPARFTVVFHHIMSIHADTTGCNTSNAGYTVNSGCFPGTIWSQKTKKLSRFYDKRNTIHRDSGSIRLSQIFYFERRNHNNISPYSIACKKSVLYGQRVCI